MKNSNIPKPRIVAFEVTHQCRYQCLHCRANAAQEASDHELTTPQCKKILAGLSHYNKCVVILTGGEPLERVDIYELLAYGRNTDQCGGCRARAYALTGDILGDDPICVLSKLKAEQNERDHPAKLSASPYRTRTLYR